MRPGEAAGLIVLAVIAVCALLIVAGVWMVGSMLGEALR